MTEEPIKQEPTPPTKLLLDDNPSNFQFHAAYLVYAELFDGITDDNAKKELNNNIEALKNNQIDPETFYANIAHYRNLGPTPRQSAYSVQTQRKRDWRVKEQRQDRIRRHKK
jgi:hypothetical protein